MYSGWRHWNVHHHLKHLLSLTYTCGSFCSGLHPVGSHLQQWRDSTQSYQHLILQYREVRIVACGGVVALFYSAHEPACQTGQSADSTIPPAILLVTQLRTYVCTQVGDAVWKNLQGLVSSGDPNSIRDNVTISNTVHCLVFSNELTHNDRASMLKYSTHS